MQVCDFCGTTETDNRAGVGTSVRRFRLVLKDINPSACPPWAQTRHWWLMDLCEICLRQQSQTLDNLVQPEIDFNALKKDGVIDASSLKEKLRQRGNSG